ncbi:MAG: ArnT family glycosyltransferase [Patescibacteria group bacterium]
MAEVKMMKEIFRKWRAYLPIFIILLIASILRLYRISDYMTFLGDEGRDALVWLRMVRDGKFTLIGPMTSIGNMYLGPLYYYLMLPFFVLFFLSPVGPAVGVALFSLATIFLLWWIGRKWFDEKVGLIAALLYAISPVVIIYSRSSWNPNVMPFFSLLTIWGVWQFWQKGNFFWLPGVGITLSFALQSHYLGLLLIPVVLAFQTVTLLNLFKKKQELKKFILLFAICYLLFAILTILPLVWFDLRHNFLNYQSFHKFFTERQTTVNLKIYKAIPNLWPLWEMMVTRLLVAKEIVWGKITALGLILGAVLFLWRSDLLRGRTSSGRRALVLILTWLVVGFLGMGLYKQHIYDHYFGFLFPALFLLAGVVLGELLSQKKIRKVAFVICLLLLVILNFKNSPLRDPPNFQLKRVREVDQKIMVESENLPFNLGLIAKQNYDAGYSFFLELWRRKPVAIEPLKAKETITGQLFVICEDPVCEPINHPKAEIANFGWSRIDKEWEIAGVKLFKLVHTQ